MYVYEMPYGVRQRLIDVLNVNDAWKDLAGVHMGYNQIELDKFRRASYRQGESPTDALLLCWGQKNHTVTELFKLLYKMRHYQAMDAIKECVDEKYHKYIQLGAGIAPTMSMTMTSGWNTGVTSGGIPYPPKTYHQSKMGNKNLFDNETNKWDPSRSASRDPYSHHPAETRSDNPVIVGDLISLDDNEVLGAAGQANILRPIPIPIVTRQDTEPQVGDVRRGEARDMLSPLNQASPHFPHQHGGGATYLGNSPGISVAPSSMGGTRTAIDPSSLSHIKQRNNSGIPVPNKGILLGDVSFEELELACNRFSPQNLLGRGGFGEVYRGRLNGQDIAVKRIREDKRQFVTDPCFQRYVDQAVTELQAMHTFPAENVLPLMAFHFVETRDPCLIYQFMPNGSVSDRLRCKDGTPPLSWSRRGNIALGTARGLVHLHAKKIIHGDIKGPNILLDKYFEPKIGDFGLARGGPESDEFSYKIISCVQGTASYLPDDYVRSRHLTTSVDTFCYGIFLFELVTGRSPSFQPRGRAYPRMRDIMLESLTPGDWVDKNPNDSPDPWVNSLFTLGRDCAKSNRKHRPEMEKVLLQLEKIQESVSPQNNFQSSYESKKNPVASYLPDTSSSMTPSYNNAAQEQQEPFVQIRHSKNSRARENGDQTDSPPPFQYVDLDSVQTSQNIPAFLTNAPESSSDQTSQNIPDFLGNASENSSSVASGGQLSARPDASSQCIPAFLNDDPSYEVISGGDSSATVSASRSQTLSCFKEEVPDISSMLYEPSMPISEHLRLLSLNSRQQTPVSNLGPASDHQQTASSVIAENRRGAQNSGSNLPSIIASLNNVQHDDNDLPTLPDILLEESDDPLANNRLLSAELGAEQASFFGILE